MSCLLEIFSRKRVRTYKRFYVFLPPLLFQLIVFKFLRCWKVVLKKPNRNIVKVKTQNSQQQLLLRYFSFIFCVLMFYDLCSIFVCLMFFVLCCVLCSVSYVLFSMICVLKSWCSLLHVHFSFLIQFTFLSPRPLFFYKYLSIV